MSEINLNDKKEVAAYIKRLEFNWTTSRQSNEELQKEADALKAKIATQEKQTRELCELILAKDHSEARLGSEYAWDKLSIRELIDKSKKCFIEYNDKKKQLLTDLQDKYEQLEADSETLSNRIVHLQEEADKAKTSGIALIVEENTDIASNNEDRWLNINKTIEMCKEYRVSTSSIPIKEADNKANKIKEDRVKEQLANLESIAKLEKAITPNMWTVMQIIGQDGKSTMVDIIGECEKKGIIEANARSACSSLVDTAIATTAVVSTSLAPKFTVFKLTDECGKKIYESRYNKEPCESEWEMVVREHDNLNHGYGIVQLAGQLRRSGLFIIVNEANRKNPIPVGNGKFFIPDIVIETKKAKGYIEYETGECTKSAIIDKLSKMAALTKHIQIVVKTRTAIVNKYIPAIKEWLSKNTEWVNQKGCSIWLSTPKYIQNLKEPQKVVQLFCFKYSFEKNDFIETK